MSADINSLSAHKMHNLRSKPTSCPRTSPAMFTDVCRLTYQSPCSSWSYCSADNDIWPTFGLENGTLEIFTWMWSTHAKKETTTRTIKISRCKRRCCKHLINITTIQKSCQTIALWVLKLILTTRLRISWYQSISISQVGNMYFKVVSTNSPPSWPSRPKYSRASEHTRINSIRAVRPTFYAYTSFMSILSPIRRLDLAYALLRLWRRKRKCKSVGSHLQR